MSSYDTRTGATGESSRARSRHEVDDDDEAPLAVLPLRGGEQLGRYVTLYRVGRGGMGEVHAAYDPQLDRKVAIKLLRANRGKRGGRGNAAMLREAQTLARVSHPHVVAIHDVGTIGERVFVAMDFVEGSTLRRWTSAQPRTPAELLAAYLQAGEGLAAAHRAGIVHRDFKPDNAIMGKDGRVQVLDFGLALVREPSSDEPGGDGRSTSRKAVGTPMYMAPEQHRQAEIGPACDQFAWCVSVYEALWKRLPFPGDDAPAITASILAGRVIEPPRGGGIAPRVRKAILRGLATDPAARFAGIEPLLAEIRRGIRGNGRRSFALAALVVSTAGVAWAAGRGMSDDAAACQGGAARMAEIWNDDVRGRISTAFLASGRVHAARSWEAVRTRIDGWADTWIAGYADACSATSVRRDQSSELLDLRMACLDRRRDELDALLRVLAPAQPDVVDRAVEATEGLPELGPCADVMALRERQAEPDTPETRALLDELRGRLAHASALERAGRMQDALAVAQLTARRAGDLPYAPLVAEAELLLGQVLENLGRPEESERALLRAAIAAEGGRDDRLLADARTMLVLVTGDRLRRQRDGELWTELAQAALARVGDDPIRASALENAIALALEHIGRPEDVLEHQRRALALAEQTPSFPPLRRATLYTNMASTLADLGRFDEALERADAGLEIWHDSYGDDHPSTAMAIAAIGMVHDHRGDYAEALAWYERSHTALVRILGEDNARTADILNNVAIAAIELGDHQRGLAELERVLEIYRAAYGETHADVAQTHQNIGSVLHLLGRNEEALEHHRRALALRERLFDPEDPRVAHSLVGVANVLEAELGRPAEALVLRQRALAIEEAVYGREHPQIVLDLANLAHNLRAVGRPREALELAERAARIADDPGVPRDTRHFSQLVLALVLADDPRAHARARSLVREAKAGLAEPIPPAEAELLVAIGRALGEP